MSVISALRCGAFAVTVLGSALVGQAAYSIGQFDGADPGAWGPWSGSGPGPLPGSTTALSTEDKTTGTTSLKLTNTSWTQNVAHQAGIQAEKDAWAANDQITFDVVTLPNTQSSGWWKLEQVVVQSSLNTGFNALPVTAISNSTGGDQIIGYGAPVGRQVVTFAIDYSSVKALWGGSTPDWLNLVMATNNDGTAEHSVVYLDNFQLTTVPEPSTVGALSVAALLLTARRRRRVA